MPTEYVIDGAIQSAMAKLMADVTIAELKPLRDSLARIKSCTLVKTNKDGDYVVGGEPAEAKKVSSLHGVFIDCDFILVVDYCTWNSTVTERQREAILFSGLQSIGVEVKEEGIKFSKVKPDIREFTTTVRRYGLYNEALTGIKDCMDGMNQGSRSFVESITTPKAEPAPLEDEDTSPSETPTPVRSKRKARTVSTATV